MTLIADSGSTKTQWNADGQDIFTDGINPFFQSEIEISGLLNTQLVPKIDVEKVKKIYFYGAGCLPEKTEKIKNALAIFFQSADIEIESDLLGAARALLQRGEGIVGILGTGSNSAFYDGKNIKSNVSPLGFILGDEGSGAALGKRLAGDVLKNMLSQAICEQFLDNIKLTKAQILDKIYRQPFPNRFLANLSVFLFENKEILELEALILNEFQSFFDRNISQYPKNIREISFVGSVAYFFAPQLMQVADYNEFRIEKIMQSPMEGLLKFHNPASPSRK
jgi:N-acetylglucosamine kinase-like BadF-type ATPase